MHEVEYIGVQAEFSGRARIWAAAGVVAVALVMFMQWFVVSTHSLTTAKAPKAVAQSEAVEGGQFSEFALTVKSIVRMRHPGDPQIEPDELKEVKEEFSKELTPLAVTRTERLRLAIVAGELLGKDEALAMLTTLEKELEPGSALAGDAAWLRLLYEHGLSRVTEEARASLIDRHQWFGQLAMGFGQPLTDMHRRIAVGGRERITGLLRRLHILDILMFIGGVGAFAIVIGKIQELRPDTGLHTIAVADEHLEAFVLFCIGFVVVQGLALLPFGMGAEGSRGALVFSEVLTWLLALVVAWPLVRGIEWSKFCKAVGLHMGDGLAIEVICGILGFLAWMPVQIGVSFLIELIQRFFGSTSTDTNPTGYPMFQAPSSDDAIVAFLAFTGAVVWAPLVEELVFRGLLFGWLRERISFITAIALVSITFGIIHPYSPLGMLQVGISGVLFGILREWRGSLIAPMVAHALHNGQIAITSFLIVHAVGG